MTWHDMTWHGMMRKGTKQHIKPFSTFDVMCSVKSTHWTAGTVSHLVHCLVQIISRENPIKRPVSTATVWSSEGWMDGKALERGKDQFLRRNRSGISSLIEWCILSNYNWRNRKKWHFRKHYYGTRGVTYARTCRVLTFLGCYQWMQERRVLAFHCIP